MVSFRNIRRVGVGKGLIIVLLLVWVVTASGIGRLLPVALVVLVLVGTAHSLRSASREESADGLDHRYAVDLGGGSLDFGKRDSAALRRARRDLRWGRWTFATVGIFIVGLGAWDIRDAASRPHVYAHLLRDGVRLDARFAGCGPSSRFDVPGRDTACRLSLTYGGATRQWSYGDDYRQFDGVRTGGSIPVLLDPAHPTTVYTVHDVVTKDNAGIGSVVGIFAIATTAFGAAVLALAIWGPVWLKARFARG